MSLKRWKITIEYDGTGYAGWQRQINVPTIQQSIEDAISKFCQRDIQIYGAGRTDAGVHAQGQVAHFDLDYGDRSLTAIELSKAINAHLHGHSISILEAEEVEPDFHARFSATNKMYRYLILNRSAPPTFQKGTVWHFWRTLDVEKMHEAAQILVGRHDFSTFRDSQCQANSPLRTLDRLDVYRKDNLVVIEAEAKSFLHHQIRNFAGTLTLIGENKWVARDLHNALQAKDRTKGGMTAPAGGLYLFRIDF